MPAPPGRPREPRVDVAVLDAALELFASGGLAAVTFEGVATRAGVSRSAVYRRWSSRDDLVVAALAEHRARGERGTRDWASGTTVGAVLAEWTRLAVLALADPRTVGLLGHVAVLAPESPVRRAYWATLVEPRRAAFAAVITAARAAGEIPAGPSPDVVQDLLAGALLYRALLHPDPLTPEQARTYVEDVVTALGLPTG